MGLFKDIENRKNVFHYKDVTAEDVLKAFEDIPRNTKKERKVSLVTGSAGMEAIRKAQEEWTVMEILKQKLLELYLTQKITAERYTKIERLLISADVENHKMAIKLINSI